MDGFIPARNHSDNLDANVNVIVKLHFCMAAANAAIANVQGFERKVRVAHYPQIGRLVA